MPFSSHFLDWLLHIYSFPQSNILPFLIRVLKADSVPKHNLLYFIVRHCSTLSSAPMQTNQAIKAERGQLKMDNPTRNDWPILTPYINNMGAETWGHAEICLVRI